MVTFGWIVGEVRFYSELAPVDPSLVGGTDWASNLCLDICDFCLVEDNLDA